MRTIAITAAALAFTAACDIGKPDEVRPLEGVELTIAGAPVPADGKSAVEITVTGTAGMLLELQVEPSGAAFSSSSDPAKVLLVDDGTGVGVGRTGLTATTAGAYRVSLKEDPTEHWRDVTFSPVTLAIGASTPVGFQADGKVVHEVCAGAGTAHGSVHLELAEGDAVVVGPDSLPLASEGAAACPSGQAGYARFRWAAAAGEADATFTHVAPGADGPTTATRAVHLEGERFAGFAVAMQDPQLLAGYALIDLTASYAAAGELAAAPAGGVEVKLVTVEPLSVVLPEETDGLYTNAAGEVTFVVDTSAAEPATTHHLFASVASGPLVYLGPLAVE